MELTRECFALCVEDVAPSMVRFVMMNGLFEMRMNVKECFFGGEGGGLLEFWRSRSVLSERVLCRKSREVACSECYSSPEKKKL